MLIIWIVVNFPFNIIFTESSCFGVNKLQLENKKRWIVFIFYSNSRLILDICFFLSTKYDLRIYIETTFNSFFLLPPYRSWNRSVLLAFIFQIHCVEVEVVSTVCSLQIIFRPCLKKPSPFPVHSVAWKWEELVL